MRLIRLGQLCADLGKQAGKQARPLCCDSLQRPTCACLVVSQIFSSKLPAHGMISAMMQRAPALPLCKPSMHAGAKGGEHSAYSSWMDEICQSA